MAGWSVWNWAMLGRPADEGRGACNVGPLSLRLDGRSNARPYASVRPKSPGRAVAEIEDNVDRELFRNVEKLRQLRIEHRDLDDVIARLTLDIHTNELQLKRLKKRKLMLKDQITRLESQLIPDLNA